ncbi:hypothetical protein [Absidia glauca]|uniref:Uncharacterized protein n=1 Tax=Absidia glauca TaxID=4829 RepID=A0A163IX32_ABSGL|nr:hypothetical protein [Absidia glauca]
MEFKKLLNKVHDKVSHTSTPTTPTPNSAPIRRRSFKDKKQATMSRWRDRWGDVSRPRFFNSSNSNNKRNNNRDDVFGPPLPTSAAALASPPTCSFQVPTITVSSPTLLKRSQSTTSPHRALPKSHYFVHQKQRPISYSPSPLSPQKKLQRLSLPHVARSPCLSPNDSTFSFGDDDDYRNGDIINEEEDAGSFYNLPVLGAPPRQVTWYVPQTDVDSRFDSPSLDQDSIKSISTTFMKSSLSSSSSCSSTTSSSTTSLAIDGALSKSYPTMYRHVTPQLRGLDSAFLAQEEKLKQDTDNNPFLSPTNTIQVETLPHYQLATLNVTNTMMAMREHQLELRMTKTRIENQRLQQQMDDMISGTWTSTNHLLAENDRLEFQIQHLQKQQRLVRSSITNSEQVYLRKNAVEADVLDRFKKLLASYG